MLKVLIVEDEPLALVGIKSLIDWEQSGYILIGGASNGQEALDIVKENVPHIIITDLMMDPMSGFELMNRCQLEYPNIKFIVLSNYNDFDNVRKAMRSGASDYIFKLTVSGEELLSVLEEVSEDIVVPEIECSDKSNKHMMHMNMSYREMSLDTSKEMKVVFLLIHNLLLENKKKKEDDPILYSFAIHNILTELMDVQYQFDMFQYYEGMYILAYNTHSSDKKEEHTIEGICKELGDYMNQLFGVSLTCILSSPFEKLYHLKKIVYQFKYIKDLLFFYKSDSQFYIQSDSICNSEEEEKTGQPPTLSGLLERLRESIRSTDFHQSKHCLQEIVQLYEIQVSKEIECNLRYTKKQVLRHFRLVYKVLYTEFQKYQINIDEVVNGDGINLEESFVYYEYLEEILNAMVGFMDQYIENFYIEKGRCGRKEIVKAKQYVEQHIEEKISITQLTSELNISESRFSHLFKEEVGLSFIDYVLKCKMDHAMHLLISTDLSIREIGNHVGVFNQNYFSMQFKKRTGMSPLQYRKTIWSQEHGDEM